VMPAAGKGGAVSTVGCAGAPAGSAAAFAGAALGAVGF